MTVCATIAVIGLPNAGKSSLLNAIVGTKIAPVHRKVQMTRRNLLGIYSTEQAQLIFTDTPGITHIEKPLNQNMRLELEAALSDCDCVLVLQDITVAPTVVLREICEKIPHDKIAGLVLNKIDLSKSRWSSEALEFAKSFEKVFRISAENREGVPELLRELIRQGPQGQFCYDPEDLTTASMRELAAQLIQEKIMENLHEEIPYETAVQIESYREGAKGSEIEAVIIVNKDSQKGMVIGKGGSTLKRIGIAARKDIEALSGGRVHLSLFVKVDTNWVKNDRKVKELFQR